MIAPIVITENLCKQYRVGQSLIDAVANISLIVRRGEFVAICGRSGSGKSTLMNILGLLERPDRGHYTLDTKEVGVLPERQRAIIRNQKIGFVFQISTLLRRSTALENVELPLIYSGIRGPERHRRAAKAWSALAWIIGDIIGRANSPEASSSASPSLAPS